MPWASQGLRQEIAGEKVELLVEVRKVCPATETRERGHAHSWSLGRTVCRFGVFKRVQTLLFNKLGNRRLE